MNLYTCAKALCLVASIMSVGCESVAFMGAPTTRSFQDPPFRKAIDPLPREALVGKWTYTGKSDRFMAGYRTTTFDLGSTIVFNDDGTCAVLENTKVSESYGGAMVAQYVKFRTGAQTESSYAGRWSYEDGVLTLHLSLAKTSGKWMTNAARKNFTVRHTLRWYSPAEFSMLDTDEQFWANARSVGDRPTVYPNEYSEGRFTWDTRSMGVEGVETVFKRGNFRYLDETRYICHSPYTRVGPVQYVMPEPPAAAPAPSSSQPAVAPPQPLPKPLFRVIGIEPKDDGSYVVSIGIEDPSQTFKLINTLMPEVQRIVRDDFLGRNPSISPQFVREYLRYSVPKEKNGEELVFSGWAFSVRPVEDGWDYDPDTRRGWIRLRITGGMPADDAKSWARKNIAAIVSEKNVALEAGKVPPSGAQYRSLAEKFEDGILTVEFETIQ